MNAMRRFPIVVVFIVAGMSGNALAAIATYTDRATWQAANGTPAFNVDFESFTADTSFAHPPLDVGPFTLSAVGAMNFSSDLVDVSPFLYPPIPASFGNAHVEIFVEDPIAADLTFHTPVNGFFADFLYPGNGVQLTATLSLAGGGTTDLTVPGTGFDLDPFGFVSTDAVASIRFHNSINDGFAIDNIAGGNVPEPASCACSRPDSASSRFADVGARHGQPMSTCRAFGGGEQVPLKQGTVL